jgi:tripartite-type tricarboxylate transporter receptor subunit TctC
MKRQIRNLAIAAAVAFAALPGAESRATYPEQPVTIVVVFPPGGGNDTTARIFAEQLIERTGQQFLVENLPGANGSVGTANVAQAAPDGYRLVVGGPGTLVQNPYLNPAAGYGPEDFTPIARLAAFDFMIVVRSALGIESLDGLIQHSKDNPDTLNYGSPGIGNTAHQAGELIKARTGADLTHIPYQGGAPATTAFLGGEVDVLFNIATEVLPHVASGDAVALAVMSPERIAQAPDVPTTGELGIEDAVISSWIGLFAPAGTPDEVADFLNAEIAQIVQDEAVLERLAGLGLRAGGDATADELAAEIEAGTPTLIELIDLIGGPQ